MIDKKLFDFGFNVESPYCYNVKFAFLTNILIFIAFLIFCFINFNINHNEFLGYIEFFVAFIVFLSTALYLKFKDIGLYLLSTTFIVFAVSIFFYIYLDKTIFSSLFIFFFPLIVFLLNGIKIGRFLTVVYVIIIFIDAYLGIGNYTDTIGFMYLFTALIVFSVFVYLFEYSRQQAFNKMMTSINKLEEISHVDELTKLYNRHYLNEKILNNERLQHKSMMFCISDIDNFKAYNDFYGHTKGDEALQQIANVKKKTIGRGDNSYIIRLGGEEFGGFMFELSNPQQTIEEFFISLEELAIQHAKNQPYGICTVSMGAVLCNDFKGSDFTRLYQIADEALYEAKESGKNKVVYKNL